MHGGVWLAGLVQPRGISHGVEVAWREGGLLRSNGVQLRGVRMVVTLI